MSEGRPDVVTDEHLTYLDELRKSGVVNMFGARTYIEDEFGIGSNEAGEILKYWMSSFGKEDR